MEHKTILVHYIDIRNFNRNDIGDYMQKVIKATEVDRETTIAYYVPYNGDTRIECINPKLITTDEYSRLESIIKNQEKLVMDTIEKLNK